jgi:hypothetical protein
MQTEAGAPGTGLARRNAGKTMRMIRLDLEAWVLSGWRGARGCAGYNPLGEKCDFLMCESSYTRELLTADGPCTPLENSLSFLL